MSILGSTLTNSWLGDWTNICEAQSHSRSGGRETGLLCSLDVLAYHRTYRTSSGIRDKAYQIRFFHKQDEPQRFHSRCLTGLHVRHLNFPTSGKVQTTLLLIQSQIIRRHSPLKFFSDYILVFPFISMLTILYSITSSFSLPEEKRSKRTCPFSLYATWSPFAVKDGVTET